MSPNPFSVYWMGCAHMMVRGREEGTSQGGGVEEGRGGGGARPAGELGSEQAQPWINKMGRCVRVESRPQRPWAPGGPLDITL